MPIHCILLYKKCKKYNSKTKNKISRNIINDYKTKNNNFTNFYDQSLSSRTNNNNKLSYSYSINTVRSDYSSLNDFHVNFKK